MKWEIKAQVDFAIRSRGEDNIGYGNINKNTHGIIIDMKKDKGYVSGIRCLCLIKDIEQRDRRVWVDLGLITNKF